jgi:hypothetical protein
MELQLCTFMWNVATVNGVAGEHLNCFLDFVHHLPLSKVIEHDRTTLELDYPSCFANAYVILLPSLNINRFNNGYRRATWF